MPPNKYFPSALKIYLCLGQYTAVLRDPLENSLLVYPCKRVAIHQCLHWAIGRGGRAVASSGSRGIVLWLHDGKRRDVGMLVRVGLVVRQRFRRRSTRCGHDWKGDGLVVRRLLLELSLLAEKVPERRNLRESSTQYDMLVRGRTSTPMSFSFVDRSGLFCDAGKLTWRNMTSRTICRGLNPPSTLR